MYGGGSIVDLHEFSDSLIFVLPSPLITLEMGALDRLLLVPANETLMHRT